MTEEPRRSRFRLRFKGRPDFWAHVVDIEGLGQHRVGRLVLASTAYSAAVCLFENLTPPWIHVGISVAPYEVAGGALSALLVLRTNAGHERWWEARKLWGGITNQCRNLATTALANGPDDPRWRRELVTWTICFAHASRRSLRKQEAGPEIAALIGAGAAGQLTETDHMPTAVALRLAEILREARDRDSLDRFAYLQADGQRTTLIDHLGACERILKTPLASAYVVLIRRFILLFILSLPFVLISQINWLTIPFATVISYPILALDRIADDLQHPFSTRSINHLPLDEITDTIERNLLALLESPGNPEPSPGVRPDSGSRLTAGVAGG